MYTASFMSNAPTSAPNKINTLTPDEIKLLFKLRIVDLDSVVEEIGNTAADLARTAATGGDANDVPAGISPADIYALVGLAESLRAVARAQAAEDANLD